MRAKLTHMKRKEMAIDVNLEKNMQKKIHDNMHKPRKEYEEKGDGRRCKPKKTQNGGNGNMFKL